LEGLDDYDGELETNVVGGFGSDGEGMDSVVYLMGCQDP